MICIFQKSNFLNQDIFPLFFRIFRIRAGARWPWQKSTQENSPCVTQRKKTQTPTLHFASGKDWGPRTELIPGEKKKMGLRPMKIIYDHDSMEAVSKKSLCGSPRKQWEVKVEKVRRSADPDLQLRGEGLGLTEEGAF